MYLIIDIGNTLHKAAVFSETGELVELQKFRQLTPKRIGQLFAQHEISHAILSAVGKYSPLVESCIRQHCPLLVLSTATPLPFSIRYQTPGSLGPDRIANAAIKSIASSRLGCSLTETLTRLDDKYGPYLPSL